MLIVRKIKPETLHLVRPLEDKQLVSEEAHLTVGRLGLQLSYAPMLRTEWRSFPPAPYADAAFLVHDGGSSFYGAFEGDRYIGCAAVTESPTGWAEVIDLRVDPQYRRLGAGRMLLDKCIAFAKKRELHGLRIACTDTNPVMCQFCEHAGFTLHGFDHMALALSPEERQKPKSRRASLLYFYRIEKG